MTGFDLRIRIDDSMATAEVLLADGSRDAFFATAIDGTFGGYMEFYMMAMTNIRGNWLDAMRAWMEAWPDAAKAEGIAELERLAKGLW